MQVKNLLSDEDAVSPVIGVILMVAITVILAAVIGAFVLGIGGSQTQTPQASYQWESGSSGDFKCGSQTGDTDVKVTHQGGDELDDNNLELGGAKCDNSETITAGTSLYTNTANSSVSLVWESPSSSDTSILSSYEP
jgi:flagellin-like protein